MTMRGGSDYKPEVHGARCDLCVLQEHGPPVPTQVPKNATVAIVASYPGNREVELLKRKGLGRPLCGRAGREVQQAIEPLGLDRRDFLWTYSMLCRPPGMSYDRLISEYTKANIKKKKAHKRRVLKRVNELRGAGLTIKKATTQARKDVGPLELLPHPVECCRPRLEHDIKDFDHVLAMGRESVHSLMWRETGIMSVQSTFQDAPVRDPEGAFDGTKEFLVNEDGSLRKRKIVPTVSPGFVQKRGRWRESFGRSIKRAIGWFNGDEGWVEPKMVGTDPMRPPKAREIWAWWKKYGRKAPYVAYDTETDSIESLRARVQCVQLGTNDRALVIPLVTRQPKIGGWYKRRGKKVWIPASSAKWFPHFYSPKELSQVRFVVWKILRDIKAFLIGHNAYLYDRLVMETNYQRWFVQDLGFARLVCKALKLAKCPKQIKKRKALGCELRQAGVWTPDLNFDTLLGHRLADGEMPHSLAFCGSYYTSVIDWKANKGAGWNAESDGELYVYGGRDGSVNSRIYEPIMVDIEAYAGPTWRKVLKNDTEMGDVCIEMKRLGYHIDQKERARLEEVQQTRMNGALRALADALGRGGMTDIVTKSAGVWRWITNHKGDPIFNANSPMQWAKILFEDWGLLPPSNLISPFDPSDGVDFYDWLNKGQRVGVYTKSGGRSTGDGVMRAHLAEGQLEPYQRDAILAMRTVRKAQKLIGDKLRTARLLAPGDYDSDGYPTVMKGSGKWPVTATWADGVLRTGWRLGTIVGRLASGDPFNLQNVKWMLRTMFVPAPGHVFVGADYDALHLRIIANLWKIPRLLEVFKKGGDPHASMAAFALGDLFRNAPGYIDDMTKPRKLDAKGKELLAYILRQIAKIVQYAGVYGAAPGTVHPIVQKAENDAGELINLSTKRRAVEKWMADWFDNEPEIPAGWNLEQRLFKEQGFLADRILGRRCYFKDSGTANIKNKLNNYRVLTEEASLAGRATRSIYRKLQRVKWRSSWTGVVEQCHDAIILQVPKERAEEACKMLEHSMNYYDCGPVPYTATADIGMSRAVVG